MSRVGVVWVVLLASCYTEVEDGVEFKYPDPIEGVTLPYRGSSHDLYDWFGQCKEFYYEGEADGVTLPHCEPPDPLCRACPDAPLMGICVFPDAGTDGDPSLLGMGVTKARYYYVLTGDGRVYTEEPGARGYCEGHEGIWVDR